MKNKSSDFLKDGFVNLTSKIGQGAQNVNSDATYFDDLLTRERQKLESIYRSSWVIGAAVDSVAEDMTRAGINITGENKPEDIQKIQTAMRRLGVWNSICETIKWGRLYGGAVALLVIDGQKTDTPLKINTVKKGQFSGLKVYDRWQIRPLLDSFIEEGNDMGLPEFYEVYSTAEGTQGAEISSMTVHHTRLIRYIGVKLPYFQAIREEYWGGSIVERLFDRLIAFDTTTAGAASLVNRAHLRTVKIDKLREVLAAGGEAEENLLKMFHHMRLLQTNEGLTLLDKEDDFQTQSYSFAGLSEMMLQFAQQISGATGIPLVRLLGQSPAGLNATGESDWRNYYDNIFTQQESRLGTDMLKILRVLHRSVLGADAQEDFDFEFVSLWQTSPEEKANIANTVTVAVTTAYEKGVIDQTTALQELKQSAENTGIFSNITEEQIEDSKIVEPPGPPETPQEELEPLESPQEGEGKEQEESTAQDRASIFDRMKGFFSGKQV